MTVLTFDEVLAKHLQGHTAPYPVTLVSACRVAIEQANKFDLFSKVELPDNVSFFNYSTHEEEQSMEVFKFVEFFHLHDFLSVEALAKHNDWMAS